MNYRAKANDAIVETILYYRKNFSGDWQNLKPNKAPLYFSTQERWDGLLGRIHLIYGQKIAAHLPPTYASLSGLRQETLGTLRDKLVAGSSAPSDGGI